MILKKREAWTNISQQYNAVAASGCRSWEQLRHLYENLKQRSKKNIANANRQQFYEKTSLKEVQTKASLDKKEINRTGGGSYRSTISDHDALILSMVAPQVQPLSNPYDDAALYFGDTENNNITDEVEASSDNIIVYETVNIDGQDNIIMNDIRNAENREPCTVTSNPGGDQENITSNTPKKSKLSRSTSKPSEARHSVARRSNDVNYVDDEAGDDLLADAASDDDTQNDAEGGDEEEEVEDAIIITQSTNYSVDLGSNVRLACQVSPSVGVVVQWRRGTVKYFLGTMKSTEQLLQTYGIDERFSIVPNSTDLLIRDVQPDDSGVYSCEILQENLPSIHHRVAVLESPRIREFIATDNGRVTEGADLVLTCDVTGSPPPKIVWSRDGPKGNERLHERDGEFFNNSVLIRNVNRQHTGKYYCYAFNSIGSNQAEVNVHVKGKPRVHVHRTVVNSAVNVEAVLQCAVHDDSDVRIRWYKDGQLVSNSGAYTVVSAGSRSNLTVTPESDAHFGTYTCEAENDLGKHNRSIDLVQSPVVENLDADGPKLSWTIHSHQPLRQIEIQLRQAGGEGEWRKITVPLPEERRHVYNQDFLLEDVESGKYEATVRVQNDKSWSHSDTALFDIEVQPELIQHASVYRGGSDSLRPTILALTTLIYLLVRM